MAAATKIKYAVCFDDETETRVMVPAVGPDDYIDFGRTPEREMECRALELAVTKLWGQRCRFVRDGGLANLGLYGRIYRQGSESDNAEHRATEQLNVTIERA